MGVHSLFEFSLWVHIMCLFQIEQEGTKLCVNRFMVPVEVRLSTSFKVEVIFINDIN